jgi:hypothetical protein
MVEKSPELLTGGARRGFRAEQRRVIIDERCTRGRIESDLVTTAGYPEHGKGSNLLRCDDATRWPDWPAEASLGSVPYPPPFHYGYRVGGLGRASTRGVGR